MNPLKLGVGVILVVIGAILMADGVISSISPPPYVFFAGVNPAFKFITGFISVLSAIPMLQDSKK